jgi:Domain of unknown function DUF29
MGSKSLYDLDVMSWSEQQASALRALSRRPELSNAIDWDNVIEEVESVGRSELNAVESQLRNALVHILKGVSDPGALSVKAWDIETDKFLSAARRGFLPSMRQRLDINRIWQDAFREAHKTLSVYNVEMPPRLPKTAPFSLEQLLESDFDFERGRRILFALFESH